MDKLIVNIKKMKILRVGLIVGVAFFMVFWIKIQESAYLGIGLCESIYSIIQALLWLELLIPVHIILNA